MNRGMEEDELSKEKKEVRGATTLLKQTRKRKIYLRH